MMANLLERYYRFELKPNTSLEGKKKAFMQYGLFVTPMLTGAFLILDVFRSEWFYFGISLALLVIILINIYVFYRNTVQKVNALFLIINDDFLQIIGNERIHFQDYLKNIKTEWLSCGQPLNLAIKIGNEAFDGITIGIKKTKNNLHIEYSNMLIQPDYWLPAQQKEQFFKIMNANTDCSLESNT